MSDLWFNQVRTKRHVPTSFAKRGGSVTVSYDTDKLIESIVLKAVQRALVATGKPMHHNTRRALERKLRAELES
jgi:hypothetical protein